MRPSGPGPQVAICHEQDVAITGVRADQMTSEIFSNHSIQWVLTSEKSGPSKPHQYVPAWMWVEKMGGLPVMHCYLLSKRAYCFSSKGGAKEWLHLGKSTFQDGVDFYRVLFKLNHGANLTHDQRILYFMKQPAVVFFNRKLSSYLYNWIWSHQKIILLTLRRLPIWEIKPHMFNSMDLCLLSFTSSHRYISSSLSPCCLLKIPFHHYSGSSTSTERQLCAYLYDGREKTCKSLDFGLMRTLGADEVVPSCELNIRYVVPGQTSCSSLPPRNSNSTPTLVLDAQLPGTPAWLFYSNTLLEPDPASFSSFPSLFSFAEHTHIALNSKVLFYSSLS